MCNWILTPWQVVPHLAVRLQFPHTALGPRTGQSSRTPALHREGCCYICSSSPPCLPRARGGPVHAWLWQRGCRALNSCSVSQPDATAVRQQPRALGTARARGREKLLCPRDCSAQDTAWIKIWSAEVLKCQSKQEGSAGGAAGKLAQAYAA